MKKDKSAEQFIKLLEIVEKLRGPDGCPWDKEQTPASLLPYFLEETYEVIESIDQSNWDNLKEELGDVMLHIALQAQISKEEGRFTIFDSLVNINKKLVHRHPHVFGDEKADMASHAKKNWEAIKHEEKKRESRLDGVPLALPALTRAQRLQEKASYAGFDWDNIDKVWGKLDEEIDELREADKIKNRSNLEEEIGDVLFSVVNLARHLKLDSEDLLRKANAKFVNRFKAIEKELAKRGKTVDEAKLDEMDELWNKIKIQEK
jgi:tetrapyrrole methylase family protein/MazG family protein|tara:strand:- start:1255 stop:2040 length:786 start_codon:yes stop_codon:yes gene_type:complete